jgi:hypothetical protein
MKDKADEIGKRMSFITEMKDKADEIGKGMSFIPPIHMPNYFC